MKMKNLAKIQADWWSKTFAGLLLGLVLAIAIGVLVVLFSIAYLDRALAPQLGMWTIAWAWCPLFFLAYFIPKGWQAIVLYSLVIAIAYGTIFWLRG